MAQVLAFVLACVATCASAADDYLLQPGDVLVVSVWKEADLSVELLMRPDGGISMPLAGDIEAAGKTTAQVRATIVERLHKFIPDAVVTVALKAASGNQIYVIGNVNRPGQYPVVRPLDVMQALSLAGGTTVFASLNGVHVLRRNGDQQVSIPFRYEDVERGKHLEQNILLRGGDTVVVP